MNQPTMMRASMRLPETAAASDIDAVIDWLIEKATIAFGCAPNRAHIVINRAGYYPTVRAILAVEL